MVALQLIRDDLSFHPLQFGGFEVWGIKGFAIDLKNTVVSLPQYHGGQAHIVVLVQVQPSRQNSAQIDAVFRADEI